jgi:hypothetical protein
MALGGMGLWPCGVLIMLFFFYSALSSEVIMTDGAEPNLNETLVALVEALNKQDTLGAVIRAHLYIENELEQFIRLRLPGGAYDALNLSYSAKVRLAGGLGYPKEGVATLEEIGRIRNKFAHKLNTELTGEMVLKLWEAFGSKGQHIMTLQLKATQAKLRSGQSEVSDEVLSPKDRFDLYAVGVWALLHVENNRWRRQHPDTEA